MPGFKGFLEQLDILNPKIEITGLRLSDRVQGRLHRNNDYGKRNITDHKRERVNDTNKKGAQRNFR